LLSFAACKFKTTSKTRCGGVLETNNPNHFWMLYECDSTNNQIFHAMMFFTACKSQINELFLKMFKPENVSK
jgi:hypothetical protein